MVRVVSECGSLLNTPPIVYWGIGGVEFSGFEHNWQGLSHFMRASGSAAWSESSRVSGNKWHFWSGIYAPSDSRLKDDVRDLPEAECLQVLRQVSAMSYVRNDLPERTRRIGFVAQDAEAALAPTSLAGTNIVGSIANGDTDMKTMSYERMSVVLWQCCRSLLARVEALEAKLAQ